MHHIKYIFLIVVFLAPVAKADLSFNGLGTIDGFAIEMNLAIASDGSVAGSYLYPRTKVPITLEGTLLDGQIALKSTKPLYIKERFTGKVTFYKNEITSIQGKWAGEHAGDPAGTYKQDGGYNFYVEVEYEIDPLEDKKVTCEEMEKYPHKVFQLTDLGSGYGSPNDVDYRCPKSLNNVEFLGGILGQASGIREPTSIPYQCSGSIVHAQWRYYHFSLAKLGYYPQGHTPRQYGKLKGMAYFEEWSYHSLYNREIYKNYLEEIENVRPKLIAWYTDTHSVALNTAEQYADYAIQTISNYGFGSYYYTWKPEPLLPHTQQAIEGDYTSFLSALPSASEEQKLNSLRRLLTHQAPNDIIKALLSTMLVKHNDERSESIISSAIYNPQHIKLLVEAGFQIDHQNSFGKTPLYYAIQHNQYDSVKVLLEQGANVNHAYQEEKSSWCPSTVIFGRTPLMHAAQHSDISILKLLLDYDANLYSQNAEGARALDYAIKNQKEENAAFLTKELNSNISDETTAQSN